VCVILFSILLDLFTHPLDMSKILPLCRYRRAAAAGFTESQQVLDEIWGVYGDDEEKTNQVTFAPETSVANSSSVPLSLPAAAAAAAEKELWAKDTRALGLHSSIHLAVAIARNFSRHKGSAATSIAEGCLARVKVEC
jgi:hypothetical protein